MNDIPVIQIKAKTMAEGYEKSLYSLFKEGCDIKTQYDKEGDPPSKDCTLNLVIENPMLDPMIHKCFPGDMSSLREYVYELEGYKNDWVKDISDPTDTRWEYLYSSRMTNWGRYKENGKWAGFFNINQIDAIIEKLIKQPYTRQAQIITWYPPHDLECYDPPCCQSIFLRITENNDGDKWLNTNIRFRSNDAYNAFMFNMFGIMQLVRTIANKIEEKINDAIFIGRLNWQADSYHIYGKDIKTCKEMLIDKIDSGQPFEKRVWNFHDEMVQEMYHECENSILEKIKKTEEGFKK